MILNYDNELAIVGHGDQSQRRLINYAGDIIAHNYVSYSYNPMQQLSVIKGEIRPLDTKPKLMDQYPSSANHQITEAESK